MNYKQQILPELRPIARKIPYNRAVIRGANVFQAVSFHLTAVPREVSHHKITLKGYRGMPFVTHVFAPDGLTGPLPCLLYVHGGAFSYKASAYHKKLACRYAAGAACRVFFPDYHLSPKYPCPAAYEDVLALYKFIAEHGEACGIEPERIGVAGDSAGAALAALLANRCAQEKLPPPCLQMLVYPLTDAAMQTDSMAKFTDTPLWNAKNNRRMWSYYCKNLRAEDMGDISPMHSPLPQVIPPAYIETAEYDCLHDEGVLYGQRLREAGAQVVINETQGTIHGYDCALHTAAAQHSVEKRILFLKRGFCGDPAV